MSGAELEVRLNIRLLDEEDSRLPGKLLQRPKVKILQYKTILTSRISEAFRSDPSHGKQHHPLTAKKDARIFAMARLSGIEPATEIKPACRPAIEVATMVVFYSTIRRQGHRSNLLSAKVKAVLWRRISLLSFSY